MNSLYKTASNMCGCKFGDTTCFGEQEKAFAAWKREFGERKHNDPEEVTKQIVKYENCHRQLADVQATLPECAPIKLCTKLSTADVEAACALASLKVTEGTPNAESFGVFALGESCIYKDSNDKGVGVHRFCFPGSDGPQSASKALAAERARGHADSVTAAFTGFGDEGYSNYHPAGGNSLVVRKGRMLYMVGLDHPGRDQLPCMSALASKINELR